jgi:hypothetical protein
MVVGAALLDVSFDELLLLIDDAVGIQAVRPPDFSLNASPGTIYLVIGEQKGV